MAAPPYTVKPTGASEASMEKTSTKTKFTMLFSV